MNVTISLGPFSLTKDAVCCDLLGSFTIARPLAVFLSALCPKMDFQITTETSDPVEECNVLRNPPPTGSSGIPIEQEQLKQRGIADEDQETSLTVISMQNCDLDAGQRPILIAAGRPTRESVLQRLSEALLRRSLTKVRQFVTDAKVCNIS